MQAGGAPTPIYQVVRRSGPDHAPVFRVAVVLENGERAEAEAGSKRSAEQAAAEILLKRLKDE